MRSPRSVRITLGIAALVGVLIVVANVTHSRVAALGAIGAMGAFLVARTVLR